MIPKIIHQTSKHLTSEENRLTRRTRALLPGWEYRLWSDEENKLLVERKFPQYASAFKSIRRGVVKADIARYMYMWVYGGFYFDTDYRLYTCIDEEMLSPSCVLPISRESGSQFRLGNAVFGSEPGHPFWAHFLGHIFTNVELSDVAESRIEETTGPEGLTAFYLDHASAYGDIFLPGRDVFHPEHIYCGLSVRKNASTIGAHLCWGSWRTKGPLGKVRAIAVRHITSFLA